MAATVRYCPYAATDAAAAAAAAAAPPLQAAEHAAGVLMPQSAPIAGYAAQAPAPNVANLMPEHAAQARRPAARARAALLLCRCRLCSLHNGT
jgi:hypothetical protein